MMRTTVTVTSNTPGFDVTMPAAQEPNRPTAVSSSGKAAISSDGNVMIIPLLQTRRFGKRRSEEHTSELQSLMRNSYAVFCLKKKIKQHHPTDIRQCRIAYYRLDSLTKSTFNTRPH